MMNDLQNQLEDERMDFQFNELYILSTNHMAQPALATSYAEKALALARKEKNKEWEAKSLDQLGTIYNQLQQFEKSIDYWNQAIILAVNDEFKARLFLNIGTIYLLLKQWENARDALEKSLTLLRKLKDASGMTPGCLGYMGVVYRELGEPEVALPYLIEALKLEHVNNNNHRGQIVNSGNIGYCQKDLEQHSRSLPYFVQALMLAEESNDLQRMGKYASEVGESYLLLQQGEKGLLNLELSYAIGVETNNKQMALNAAWFLRQCYRNTEQFLYAAHMEEFIASHHREIGDVKTAQHHANLAQELRKTDQSSNKTGFWKRMRSSKKEQLSSSLSTMRETILVKKQQGKIVHNDPENQKMGEWETESKNLVGIDLSGKNLSGANFVKCDLSGANLEKCNLRMSELDMANFQEANLKRANLWGSEMFKANLKGANLEGADLGATMLMDSNLIGANMKRAYLLDAVISKVDMTGANLENAIVDEERLIKEATLTNTIMPDGSLYKG